MLQQHLTGYQSLIHYQGNYVILPFALLFGRRPAFLLAIIVTLGSTIGAALSNSYEGHLAARIIQGLATSSTESVSVPSVTPKHPSIDQLKASPTYH